MEKKYWNISCDVYKSMEATPEDIRNILLHARDAREGSYAPYSRFHVGAALLLDNGQIIHGSNQENASYPIGLCAERTALSAKASLAPHAAVSSLAVTVHSESKVINTPAAPCGICRQSILEQEERQGTPIRIILCGDEGEVYVFHSIKDLMPLYFGSENL